MVINVLRHYTHITKKILKWYTRILILCSVYALFIKKRLLGINGSYVDDLLRAGSSKFKKLCKTILRNFEITPDEDPPFLALRFWIEEIARWFLLTGSVILSQKYKNKEWWWCLEYTSFKKNDACLLVNSLSDLCVEISKLAPILLSTHHHTWGLQSTYLCVSPILRPLQFLSEISVDSAHAFCHKPVALVMLFMY